MHELEMKNYFTLKEFFPNCHDYEIKQVINSSQYSSNLYTLWFNLNCLRNAIDLPIRITSGYRSPAHNLKVSGSSPTSQHQFMAAVDITCSDLQKLLSSIMDSFLSFGQCIVYKQRSFIHLALPCDKYKGLTVSYV